MYIVAIANILDKHNRTTSLRLLDAETGEVRDTLVVTIQRALIDHKIKIQNIGLTKSEYLPEIIGINGTIDKLPKIRTGRTADNEQPIIIIYKLDDIGYVISNYLGQMAKVTTKQLIEYATIRKGISNGKITKKGNKQIISSINGKFPVKQISKEERQKFEEIDQRYNPVNAKMTLVRYPYKITVDGGIIVLNTDMKRVNITNPVRYIPNWAFLGCNKLQTVDIASTVKMIESNAFRVCSQIRDINIQEGLEIIGDAAFEGCGSLTAISLPDSLTKIGKSTFAYCGIKDIKVPNKLTVLDKESFQKCRDLKRITLPNGLKAIGDRAFEGCTSIESITLPDTIEVIGYGAFRMCSTLKNINIPKNLKKVGQHAFLECKMLSENTIKNFERYRK